MWEQLPLAFHLIFTTLTVKGTQWIPRGVAEARDQGGCLEEGASTQESGRMSRLVF